MTTTITAHLDVRQNNVGDWTITSAETLTDEGAKAITFRADPKQVVLGTFVEVVDPDGIRIGHVSLASYHERLDGPAFVTCAINLR